MPTYDYECQSCGHRFEFFQSMKDDKLTDCPLETCEGNVRRLLGTGAGLIFKGSGFYETDYRSESYKAGEKAAKDSSTSSSTSGGEKSTSSTDSKPKSDSGSSSTSSGSGGSSSTPASGGTKKSSD